MFRYASVARAALATVVCCSMFSLTTAAPPAGGAGRVLPPTAKPLGWSMEEMAAAVINFSISGNDPAYFPETPFQILYRFNDPSDPANNNTFTVPAGTFLYVKVFFIDDSEPVIGDWPESGDDAADYIFGDDELGADIHLVVDGRVASLNDAGYIGGPVETPESPDGSEHGIQIGAFVSPLNKGEHTVTIHGVLTGDAWIDFAGGPSDSTVTFKVIVE